MLVFAYRGSSDRIHTQHAMLGLRSSYNQLKVHIQLTDAAAVVFGFYINIFTCAEPMHANGATLQILPVCVQHFVFIPIIIIIYMV